MILRNVLIMGLFYLPVMRREPSRFVAFSRQQPLKGSKGSQLVTKHRRLLSSYSHPLPSES